MQSGSSIAVIIPCYNHTYILRRTIKCLLNQTLKPAEVVIVNDGSTDDFASVISDLHLPSSIFHLLSFPTNRGAPAARNEGARQTTAPYLLFLDADAELVPGALEHFATVLDAHPKVDFVYSNFLWGRKRFYGQPFDGAALKRRNFIHTSSLLRRSAFPGFDESLKKFQDWDLWLTMIERGSRGYWIDKDLYRIEPRREGMSRWMPKIMHKIPWPILGYTPQEMRKYRLAEAIVRKKHHI